MAVCAGRKLGKGPSGPRRTGALMAEIFQGFFGYRGSVVVSYMTVSEP